MDSVFIKVPVSERLPDKDGLVVCVHAEGDLFITHYDKGISIGSAVIQDKRELTATFFVNSIRLLDEQGARHLVKELCERFHLLPSEEQISKEYKLLKNEIIPHFKDGANYILNTLKGEKR